MNTCDSANQMLGYLCQLMDDAEQEELRQHLADGCPECSAALADAEFLLSLLLLALDPVNPPAITHTLIMAKVHGRNSHFA